MAIRSFKISQNIFSSLPQGGDEVSDGDDLDSDEDEDLAADAAGGLAGSRGGALGSVGGASGSGSGQNVRASIAGRRRPHAPGAKRLE